MAYFLLLPTSCSFPVDDRGTTKSVVQYFYETYGFVIRHTQWPCLQVGNQNRPNYLPMEVIPKPLISQFWFCCMVVLCADNLLEDLLDSGLQDCGGPALFKEAQ